MSMAGSLSFLLLGVVIARS